MVANACFGSAKAFVVHFWCEWLIIMAESTPEKPKGEVIQVDFIKKVRKKVA